uniref:HhH-GPD domain-containing protein n=1 Tax=Auxenochlorella protothecoides TaxID=3075 RepID=A0A1D2A838_AUXPR
MSNAAAFWGNVDLKKWQAALDDYWTLIEGWKPALLDNERWLQEALPGVIRARDPPELHHEELVRLVDWKLSRGKWRPRLQAFAKELAPASVADASRSAFASLYKDSSSGAEPGPSALKSAFLELTKLKGVGPATASAVLQAFHPSIPFMSDEAMMAALGEKAYTIPIALEFIKTLREKAAELNKLDAERRRSWTAKDVEHCLFADHLARMVVERGARPPAARGKRKR